MSISSRRPPPKRLRPPWFIPVPLRERSDGWTPERQCLFLAALYTSGSVHAAARAAGMTRETAYRLRRRAGADSFAAAWDRILRRHGRSRKPDWRKVTPEMLVWRVETGFWKPIVHRRSLCGIAHKPDDTALLHATRRIGKDERASA